VSLGVRVQTWDTFPVPNFVKIAQGDDFYQKFDIYAILNNLSPHFYTHNITILLNGTDLGIHQQHLGIHQQYTISSK